MVVPIAEFTLPYTDFHRLDLAFSPPREMRTNLDTARQIELANAIATSTFDTTFMGIMQNDLTSYAQAVKTAYNANPGPKGNRRYGMSRDQTIIGAPT